MLMIIQFIPWLRSRKHLFFSVFIDLFSLLIIINSLLLQNNLENYKHLISTLFICNWIIINYVFGRYHSFKSNTKRSYFFYVLISLISLIIFLGCFSLQLFLFNSFLNRDYFYFELVVKSSVYVFLVSNIIQLIYLH